MARRRAHQTPRAAKRTPVLTWRLDQRGAALAELLVALMIAGIVLGTATATVLRQQRTTASLGGSAARASQTRAALGVLSVELSALAVASGDLVPAEMRDSSIQLRAVVAAGLACGDAVGLAVLVADLGASATETVAADPHLGDTLWWYDVADGGWRGRAISVADSVTTTCPLDGGRTRTARRIVIAAAESIRSGAPLRITRPVRYSFYRSGDGSLQLGLREWSEAGHRFAPPQPVAGPFVARDAGDRSGFRYFDADGTELPSGADGVDAERVARVRVTVLARSGGQAIAGVRRDSIDVALQREQ